MDLQDFLEMDDVQKYERLVELERIAFTDRMTGCKNRNWFIENRKSIESGFSTAIIIDIDHFKMVNDTLGHDAGDEVLKNVAAVIMNAVRFTDTIRYGGEEFLVITQGITFDDSLAIAERIRKAVEKNTTVTISIGVAPSVTAADRALYDAKASGRNRVSYRWE